ncbi:hypothetical protein AAHE18_05G153200 [Arachis hypogaea]
MNHDIMDIWVQIYGIPLELMEEETAIRIGYMMGIICEVEDLRRNGALLNFFEGENYSRYMKQNCLLISDLKGITYQILEYILSMRELKTTFV